MVAYLGSGRRFTKLVIISLISCLNCETEERVTRKAGGQYIEQPNWVLSWSHVAELHVTVIYL
jgi:hypothetical protein